MLWPMGWAAWMCLGCSLFAGFPEMIPLNRPLEQSGFEEILRSPRIRVLKHRDSECIRIAAEGVFPAPVERVLAVLLDYPGQQGRVKRVTRTEILERAPDRLRVYQQLNLPVISDRDFTLEVRWGASGQTRWITYAALESGGPEPRRGVVRVTHHQGSWQLQPVSQGRGTLVRFQVSIDLSGSLPKWMARAGAGRELPELFENLALMLRASDERKKS